MHLHVKATIKRSADTIADLESKIKLLKQKAEKDNLYGRDDRNSTRRLHHLQDLKNQLKRVEGAKVGESEEMQRLRPWKILDEIRDGNDCLLLLEHKTEGARYRVGGRFNGDPFVETYGNEKSARDAFENLKKEFALGEK